MPTWTDAAFPGLTRFGKHNGVHRCCGRSRGSRDGRLPGFQTLPALPFGIYVA